MCGLFRESLNILFCFYTDFEGSDNYILHKNITQLAYAGLKKNSIMLSKFIPA